MKEIIISSVKVKLVSMLTLKTLNAQKMKIPSVHKNGFEVTWLYEPFHK